MRLIKLITLLILFTCPTLLKTQLIQWKEDKPLTWADFKGKPDFKSGVEALTTSFISYNYNWHTDDGNTYIITFNLQSVFDTQASFVRRDYESDELLSHEQLHFDINELFTRKLAAAFHSAIFTGNFKAEIEDIYGKCLNERHAMQAKYDTESEHSLNKNMQLRWQLYVYEQLKALPRNY